MNAIDRLNRLNVRVNLVGLLGTLIFCACLVVCGSNPQQDSSSPTRASALPAAAAAPANPFTRLVRDTNYDAGFHTLTIEVNIPVKFVETAAFRESRDTTFHGYQLEFTRLVAFELEQFRTAHPNCVVRTLTTIDARVVWVAAGTGAAYGGPMTLPSAAFVTLACGLQ